MAGIVSKRRSARTQLAWSRVGLVVGTALLSTACASQSYMGISLMPGQAPSELQDLAQRACSGDKQAQLDLGIRYEKGIGVPNSSARALRLYRQAASDSSGTIWLYVPSVGNGTKGRVIPVNTGAKRQGLVEARSRLAAVAASKGTNR